MPSPFSREESERYNRQQILPGFGEVAQQKLKNAKVLVIGAGGLGCPVLQYLAAAGVGHMGIMDHDTVSLSNLHRQVLYTTEDIGKLKVEIARHKLLAMNPGILIEVFPIQLTSKNVLDIIGKYDLVVDTTDNFPSRYLINDACVILHKPLVYGSVHQYEGQVSVFNLAQEDGTRSPHYRDLYPLPPKAGAVPDCASGGVIGVLPGIIGSMQANEAIKIITGVGKPLAGKLLLYDSLSSTIRTIHFIARKETLIVTQLIDYELFCGTKSEWGNEITHEELDAIKESGVPFHLIDVREMHEREHFNIGGLNIPINILELHGVDIPKNQLVIVYCKSGKRGKIASDFLVEKWGFDQVRNLKYGLDGL